MFFYSFTVLLKLNHSDHQISPQLSNPQGSKFELFRFPEMLKCNHDFGRIFMFFFLPILYTDVNTYKHIYEASFLHLIFSCRFSQFLSCCVADLNPLN